MKEPTATKLFVGQIPRDWTESELRPLFEPYGEIHSLNLLLEKSTGQHKGCAFLTYFDNDAAKAAAEDLHEKRTLPGARHLLQVKPASSESEDTRKLFIGMISKTADEAELREMFSPHGTIEELTVLKGNDGASKGCAFLKYETRLQASKAIKEMHNSITMEGMRIPIVVKLADSERDKAAKRKISEVGMSGANSSPSLYGGGAGGGLGARVVGGGVGLAGLTGMQNSIQPAAASIAGGVATLAQQVAYYQQVFAQMGLPQVIAAAPGGIAPAAILGQQLGQSLGQQLQQPIKQETSRSLGAYGGSSTNSGTGYGSSSGVGAGYGTNVTGDSTIQQAYSGIQQYISTVPSSSNSYGASVGGGVASSHLKGDSGYSADRKSGPEGANLFIYQIPGEFTDTDLSQTFMPFGNVISAKVFIDKMTGQSKGFGFVSYDNATSAASAISAMNGFAIGSKRLKVQLKKPKDSKPY